LDRVHPDDRDRVEAIIRQALKRRHAFAFDHRIVRSDGAVRTVHTAGEVVVDTQGRSLALAGAGQDITERKQIEDELHRSREELRRLAARLEGAREGERARMAREIHDELGGMLTGLKMDVARLRRGSANAEPRTAERLESLTSGIDDAIQTVRRIASDLRPAVLDDFGLVAAMEWQLNDFVRRSGLQSSWTSAADSAALPRENTTAVFRVFQESLTNIARHAEATHVDVAVEARDGWLLLRVADNGRGITPEQTLGAHSLGLAGMRERMAALGGSVEITGSPGVGTTVVVRVPLAG
jgi:signal transduction histidine kinase